MSGGKVNPAAIAALPISVLLTLSALLPYFQAGDAFSGYSYSASGWSFFSTVNLLMTLGVLLSGVLLVATLVPEIREGKVGVKLGGNGDRSLDVPLIAVPAAAVALLAALVLFLLMLRIFFPPSGLSQGAGLFFGAFLAVALVGSAAGAIVIDIAPDRSVEGATLSGHRPTGTASPPTPPAGAAPPPTPQTPTPSPPPGQTQRVPGREPPPPAPGTRRG